MHKQALKMAGSRTRLIAIAAVAALSSTALAACGGGDSTATTSASGAGQVTASAYVSSVCGAVGNFYSSFHKDSASLQQGLAQANDLGAAKSQLSKIASQTSSDSQQLATDVKAAGTPEVSNGEQIASKLSDNFDQLARAYQGAEAKVNALQTSSPQAFSSGVQSYTASLAQENTQLSKALPAAVSGSSELQAAAKQSSECQAVLGA